MKKTFVYLFAIFTLGVFVSSCGDDTPPPITGEALFTYEADGLTVTFTNTSTVSGTVTYAWDFGDGETSTEKDPVHTYASKGEYTVTLTVTDEQGGTHPVSTKIAVDRKARVSLDDNSVSDWDAVTEPEFVISLGDNSGIVKQVKFDYDAEYVYMYINFEGAISDSTIFNVLLDADLDATGFATWIWPLMGGDYLWQGQLGIGDDSWLDIYKHTGADHGWGWEPVQIDNYYVFGGAFENNGTVSYEIGFDRAKIPGLNNEKVKFGIYLADKGWAEIGFAPDQTVDESNPADGFILNMK